MGRTEEVVVWPLTVVYVMSSGGVTVEPPNPLPFVEDEGEKVAFDVGGGLKKFPANPSLFRLE